MVTHLLGSFLPKGEEGSLVVGVVLFFRPGLPALTLLWPLPPPLALPLAALLPLLVVTLLLLAWKAEMAAPVREAGLVGTLAP